jgi:hypothetical protein
MTDLGFFFLPADSSARSKYGNDQPPAVPMAASVPIFSRLRRENPLLRRPDRSFCAVRLSIRQAPARSVGTEDSPLAAGKATRGWSCYQGFPSESRADPSNYAESLRPCRAKPAPSAIWQFVQLHGLNQIFHDWQIPTRNVSEGFRTATRSLADALTLRVGIDGTYFGTVPESRLNREPGRSRGRRTCSS